MSGGTGRGSPGRGQLISEWMARTTQEERVKNVVKVLLPNFEGQRYVFGSVYPGVREGEEFLFMRDEKIRVDPTLSVISVDEEGQYWIQSDPAFGSSGRVLEPFLLKIGDSISSEVKLWREHRRHLRPSFYAKEEKITGGEALFSSYNEALTVTSMGLCFASSPLAYNLILSEIMTFLRVMDLKVVRLVCKKWGEEGTKALEKRGQVSFTFDLHYIHPKHSTRVFRYLHEMKNMKIRNLQIRLNPRPRNRFEYYDWLNDSEGAKGMDDLRTLLTSSHAFSSLFLQTDMVGEAEFPLFSTIFQQLGGKLVELRLGGRLEFLPELFPQFPMLTKLRKFTHSPSVLRGRDELRWVSLLVSLFATGLETFTCGEVVAVPYLQAFLEQGMPNLRGVAIVGEAAGAETLSLLLLLTTPLHSLNLFCSPPSDGDARLEELLFKHSKTLKTLVLRIETAYFPTNTKAELRFPPFPRLEALELEYGRSTRIGWGENGLDYKKHFPSLRKLTIRPPGRWREDDAVFNAFFPDEGGLTCKTVRDLRVPVLESCQRMDQIMEMFPNAVNKDFFTERYWSDSSDDSDSDE